MISSRSFPMCPQASLVWRRLAPARIHHSSFMDTSGCTTSTMMRMRRTSLGRGKDHRFPPQPCTTIKAAVGINWNVIFPDLRNYYQVQRWQKQIHHIYSYILLRACMFHYSVILATTDTQSCLLACSCPNACHAKKNDSGVTRLGIRWSEISNRYAGKHAKIIRVYAWIFQRVLNGW